MWKFKIFEEDKSQDCFNVWAINKQKSVMSWFKLNETLGECLFFYPQN